MGTRRKFIETTVKGIAGLTLLPTINAFSNESYSVQHNLKANFKLRFALASDGHYGQPGTDSDAFYTDLVDWMHREHQQNHLDLIIFNGDLVHNRPDLLSKVKHKYLDKLPVPYYTIPGNHDFADSAIWKNVFGYEDKYTIELGDTAFVLANTATTKGEYVCPDNRFLKTALDSFKNKTNVFVVLHIPPHQWMPEEEKIFLDCPDTVALLHNYPNIKAVFHGHDHSIDGVRYTKNIPHFFDAHIGGDWGTSYKGYRIVDIDESNQINTYQVNASQSPILNTNKI